MSNKATIRLIATILVLGGAIAPAMADHDDWDHSDYGHYGYKRDQMKHWQRKELDEATNRHHLAAYPSDWNEQKLYLANHWDRRNDSRLSKAERKALNEQLRAQWNAYHHNNYYGDYSWNIYNNPEFMDYVHTNNPGVFTQLRTYLGI